MPSRQSLKPFVTWCAVLCLSLTATSSCRHRAPTTSESDTPRPSVIVVGGGLAGLVAAYELEKRGIDTQILESTDRLGGRVATAHYGDSIHAEYGMQEIWEKSPLLPLAQELGLSLESAESPFSSVMMNGKLYPFTQATNDEYFRTLFTAKEYEAQKKFLKNAEELHRELSILPLSARLNALNDVSFADWLDGQGLPAKVSAWIRLTLECELGAPADRFSALSGLSEFRVFLYQTEKVFHVAGGNSELIRQLAERISGPKHLGAKVTALRQLQEGAGNGPVEVSYFQEGTLKTLQADAAIVAIPWFLLHQLQMDPPFDDARWHAIDGIGRGQYVVVHFLVDRDVESLWGEKNPFPILSEGPLGVIYGFQKSESPERLRAFSLLIHGDAARAFHMAPQDKRRISLLTQLDALWPGFSKHVQSTSIYTYHPAAIPYWPTRRSPFDIEAQGLFEPHGKIYLAGDYLVSSHSEGAVVSAQRQATAIADMLLKR